ncbi:hypothetical protein [Nannocystis sp.]|uniref:hypothetical protein n=1 Tax=Nannocystis sp. TaxID=1962667 RepID=UPI0025FBD595|nr:hypothetical protein [Nannocystis sp.]
MYLQIYVAFLGIAAAIVVLALLAGRLVLYLPRPVGGAELVAGSCGAGGAGPGGQRLRPRLRARGDGRAAGARAAPPHLRPAAVVVHPPTGAGWGVSRPTTAWYFTHFARAGVIR